MADTLVNALRLVKPREMVVSITEILDKIGNKLTADEKEQLLIAMLSPRREKIQPGDLITSDLLNQTLLDVADLQVRVSKLETSNAPVQGAPIIKTFNPLPPFVPGQGISVIGENFSVPGSRNTVTVDGVLIVDFGQQSSASSLVFSIPSNINVLLGGRSVLLSITNSEGKSASTSIQIKQPVIIPTGGIVVAYITPPLTSGSVAQSGSYVLEYRITPQVDVTLNYDLRATASATGWKAEILNDAGNQNLPMPVRRQFEANKPYFVKVRVTASDTAQISDTCVIDVRAEETTLESKVTAGSRVLTFKVGDPVPVPDSRVQISLKEVPQGATLDKGRLILPKPSGNAPTWVVANFLVKFSQQAESGDYSIAVKIGNSSWTVDGPTTVNNGGGDTEIQISILASSATAPITDVLFTIAKNTLSASYLLPVGVST